MSNFQSINDEEIEQDQLVSDVATLNTSVLNINNKLNMTASSNMKTAIDLNTAKTSFPGFGTSEGTALQGNTTTISSAQATAINANSLKTSFPGFGTTGGTALEGNTALLQLGTTSSTALAGDTPLLQLGSTSSTALAGDTVTISSAQSNAITANTAKVSSQWSNNGSEIYINENVGIKNSNPNCDLEIGNTTGVVRLRLNGNNGLTTSSELLFTDSLSNTAEYFQGVGIRFDSYNNKLQFITDNDNDGVAEIQMSINRSDGFVGIKDTTPSFELDVNGEINGMKQYHYYQSGIPMIIGITSLNSSTVSYHRLGYGQGSGNGAGSITENTFFMPDTNFRVVFRPFSTKIFVRIHYLMDRYFSGRSIYWALGTTSSSSSIIGRTVTFSRGGNSEWTSRQEVITLHDQGYTPYTSYVRYIFCKSIVVNSDNTIGSTSGNTGWILWGGHGTHSDGGGQTTGHYETDSSPNLPTDSDNFGPLEAVVYGIPDGFSTASTTANPLQYIGY